MLVDAAWPGLLAPAVEDRLRALPAEVCLVLDRVPATAAVRTRFADRAMVTLWREPLGCWRGVLKRAMDLALGAPALVMLMPAMLAVAAIIRLDSEGPVLIRQRRFGFANQPFTVLKFRTMYWNRCDGTGAAATIRNDPRVTRVGRVLRALSIDELPQLFNVLKGDMSLIGPRAHPVEMRVCGTYYHEAVRCYAARHRMKPGMTGLAQVSGCRGSVATMEQARQRLE